MSFDSNRTDNRQRPQGGQHAAPRRRRERRWDRRNHRWIWTWVG
ncbi:hypothetical protein [Gordonia phthalatica]|nr:hypothetical protein [Gordonia phthalatica]